MPISDTDPYHAGHFERVYKHIIKPACLRSDFSPIRADDVLTTNFIALDIIKKLIECDMAICDLSSRNPNVLYELGIRQAFNLPVTLIKDKITSRIFDIQGFRDIEYDETLRFDTVESVVISLAETLRNTYDNKDEINSLISLLGIQPAKISIKTEISRDTELILNSIQSIYSQLNEKKNPFSAVNLKYVIDEPISAKDISSIFKGDYVHHAQFGLGEILDIDSVSGVANVLFENKETRRIMLRFAKLNRAILS